MDSTAHAWAGLTTGEHKKLKKLKSENLRDNMSDAELIFTALAELSTRQISEKEKADGFDQNATAAKKGGAIAKHARKELEQHTGKPVVSDENFLGPAQQKPILPKRRK